MEVQFQNDSTFYWRFFGEVCLYLKHKQPQQDWYAVIIYAKRSLDPGVPRQWRGFLASQQVERIYLNELGAAAERSLGLGLVQLVVSSRRNVPQQAQRLIQQAREIPEATLQRQIIDLIETIVFYKFPNKSRKEIEAMFGLSELKQTKIYQEAKEEGKLEAVSRLLKLNLSIEQIAEVLALEVEQVRQVLQAQADD